MSTAAVVVAFFVAIAITITVAIAIVATAAAIFERAYKNIKNCLKLVFIVNCYESAFFFVFDVFKDNNAIGFFICCKNSIFFAFVVDGIKN
jgi:hypothetical protein